MLSIAKPIKIKVLLHQFSLLMFNLHHLFLFTVFLPDHSIAALPQFYGKCRTVISTRDPRPSIWARPSIGLFIFRNVKFSGVRLRSGIPGFRTNIPLFFFFIFNFFFNRIKDNPRKQPRQQMLIRWINSTNSCPARQTISGYLKLTNRHAPGSSKCPNKEVLLPY